MVVLLEINSMVPMDMQMMLYYWLPHCIAYVNLNICSTNAHEFNVLFNYAKSKLITFSSNREFMNGVIDVVPYDKHLGDYIENINQNDVSHITNDFLCRVNMLKIHFN